MSGRSMYTHKSGELTLVPLIMVKTGWIASKSSPRGHPNPRPDPPDAVILRFGAAVSDFLSWAAYHWPGDATLKEWHAAVSLAEREPEASQRDFWWGLAEQFHGFFADDYPLVDAGSAAAVFTAPKEQYSPGPQQREEEEKIRHQLGGKVLRKYKAGWKECVWRHRRHKTRFFELAGLQEKFRAQATTSAQREEAWEHVLALVALARCLFPPECRRQAEFPTLFDLAEQEARSAVPRDPDATCQSEHWHSQVLRCTQAKYQVIVRKARDPTRAPDGHPKYPLPKGVLAVAPPLAAGGSTEE
jgi:hypothetical protein